MISLQDHWGQSRQMQNDPNNPDRNVRRRAANPEDYPVDPYVSKGPAREDTALDILKKLETLNYQTERHLEIISNHLRWLTYLLTLACLFAGAYLIRILTH